MADFLTAYADAQPDKLAVIDDRPGGDVTTLTFAELNEQAEPAGQRAARPRRRPGRHEGRVVRAELARLVADGQRGPQVGRHRGAAELPAQSDEEAAYVTDHSDATIVYVDAEYAPMFERIRADIPKVRAHPGLRRRGARRA